MKTEKVIHAIEDMEKNGIHLMTAKEIENRLKSLVVGEGDVLPLRIFSFIVPNPEYDPENFSQEIEDSEEEVDTLELMKREMDRPDFDFVWHNTFCQISKNSDKWHRNHTKKCMIKIAYNEFWEQCTNHKDTRNYFSERTMGKIRQVIDKYGGIVAIA